MSEEKKKEAVNISTNKAKEMEARLEQENSHKTEETPAGDVYSKVEKKDSESGVEKPTKEAVEEAVEWSQENQM